jgi:NADH-quinone oxidoreductase subunit L
VALIPLLPALAFVALLPLSRETRNRSPWISVVAIFGSLTLSVAAALRVWPGGHEAAEEPIYHATYAIAQIAGEPLSVGLQLDPIAAVMILVITIVGAGVQLYSLGYMHRDGRVGWYYAVLSLFTSAMLLLVLADNFLLLYLSWEVMGLCSYLLIGFWHEQEAPRRASIKAFLTTRIGDVGFMLGLFAMYSVVGSFAFTDVLHHEWAPAAASAVAFGLLFGAMGKSAQVPLHVWLPDAMAGPTPASALIHAATMVAAGVYLVARALPVFEASGSALTATLIVGSLTALMGGLMATVQHDIKKVLAYSTISQLGYMFVALGAGGATAALYHLVTHAFFKSLLFLGAGVIIHAYHTQDMREMGGLRSHLPWTTATFTVGSLALAGIFPFSGFWSKDEILTVLLHEHQYVAFAIALAAAFVTAFYVARLWFRVFAGPKQAEELHEAHWEMIVPMVVLTGITAVIGFGGPRLGDFLGHEIPYPQLSTAAISTAAAVAGLVLSWWFYGRSTVVVNTRTFKDRSGYLYDVLAQKFYFDLTFEHLFLRPFDRLADRLAVFDGRVIDGAVNLAGRSWARLGDLSWRFDIRIIDGGVNGMAQLSRSVARQARRLQSGRIQSYQRLAMGALVLLLLVIVVKG